MTNGIDFENENLPAVTISGKDAVEALGDAIFGDDVEQKDFEKYTYLIQKNKGFWESKIFKSGSLILNHRTDGIPSCQQYQYEYKIIYNFKRRPTHEQLMKRINEYCEELKNYHRGDNGTAGEIQKSILSNEYKITYDDEHGLVIFQWAEIKDFGNQKEWESFGYGSYFQ